MRTTIEIIIICLCLVWLSKPTFSWPPFRIHFENAFTAIGIFLIMVGIIFLILDGHTEAYSKGLKKGCEIEREAALNAARQLIEESKSITHE